MKKVLFVIFALIFAFQVSGQQKDKTKEEKDKKEETDSVGTPTTYMIIEPDPGGEDPTYPWNRDYDGDGYGDPDWQTESSTQPNGYVANRSDCDDYNANTYPGAPELADGKDNDCDGLIDEGISAPALPSSPTVTKYCGYTRLTRGTPPTGVTWYWQSSSSGTSTSSSSSYINLYSGSVYYLRARDNNNLLWSSSRSVSYTIDVATTWYYDGDGDGFGDPAVTTSACSPPTNYVSNANDNCPGVAGPNSGCVEVSVPVAGLSNENFVFSRTYLNPYTDSSNLSSDDVMEEVTYFDGLGRSNQHVALRAGGNPHSSIISTSSWAIGSGSSAFYNQNGSTTENSRELGIDPFGRDELLWKCGNDTSSNADGGWDTDYFNVDKNASYQYSVWVKRTGSQDGTTYFGTQNVNNLSGTANSNPYFWYGDTPALDQWYLLVGVIHPYTYGGGYSGISGVYDINGNKVITGTEFKWQGTTTITRLRSYLYYATNTSTRQYFWNPVFQKMDGTQSSVLELVNNYSKADVVTHIEYDQFGRQAKDHLPIAKFDDEKGSFRNGDISTEIASYYRGKFDEDFIGMTDVTANPFSEKVFEASPLNRIKQQAAPGKDWAIGNGHEIKFEYNTNITSEVRNYYVTLNSSYTPEFYTTSYYAAGTLYKSITKDENWTSGKNNTTEEFKDKQGRVVLKRSYNAGIAHDTYYVYDDYGNLTYVLPPKSDPHSAKPNAIALFELCYQYKYDKRNRLVEKKIPGKGDPNDLTSGWEYIVYNKLDQPILTQDPNLKAQNKWLFTKYDAFGRVVYTGIMSRNVSRALLQSEADNTTNYPLQYEQIGSSIALGGGTVSYTNTAYPKNNITQLNTVNYYDTYLDSNGMTVPSPIYSVPKASNTKGLVTVSKVRVLGENDWITTIMGYDTKGNVIYSKSNNAFLNSTDEIKNKLDFVGMLLESTTVHTRTGQPTITTIDRFTYDHMGRFTKQAQKVNANAEELIAENSYDELGQLEAKKVGGSANGIGLQNVDYSYNVRGWLKQINNPASLGTDLFGFKLNYNTKELGSTNANLYNGNISETIWKTANDVSSNKTRGYAYKYDDLNRITYADYGIKTTGSYNLGSGYDMQINVYDKNGNMKDLTRYGATGKIDQLTYNYFNNEVSNKLLKVGDAISGTEGFKNGSTGDDYAYDSNGNMTSDLNKGIPINGITYNHLNLPTSVTLPGGTISYIYDATGVKLKKSMPGKETFYAGNYIYEKVGIGNTELQFFNHPEGYVEYDGESFNYVYNYTDHMGNVRLSYSDTDGNGAVESFEIKKESHYYPFGMRHQGYNNVITSTNVGQQFTFNGQQYDESLKLNVQEMTFRQYDPAIGRFNGIDRLAALIPSITPYRFGFNNPILWADPTGLIEESVLMDIYNRSSSRTTWQNDGYSGFYSDNGGYVGYTSANTEFNSSPGSLTALSGVTVNLENQQSYQNAANQIAQNIYKTKWYNDDVDLVGFGINAAGNVSSGLSGFATYKVANAFKSNSTMWGFQSLTASQQAWRANVVLGSKGHAGLGISGNALGKYGTKLLKGTKVLGPVATVAGVGYSGYKIYSGTATKIDYVDAGVGIASIGAAVFLASNPVGWTISAGAGVYFAGRFVYDIIEETND